MRVKSSLYACICFNTSVSGTVPWNPGWCRDSQSSPWHWGWMQYYDPTESEQPAFFHCANIPFPTISEDTPSITILWKHRKKHKPAYKAVWFCCFRQLEGPRKKRIRVWSSLSATPPTTNPLASRPRFHQSFQWVSPVQRGSGRGSPNCTNQPGSQAMTLYCPSSKITKIKAVRVG